MSDNEVIAALTDKRAAIHRQIVSLRQQLKAVNGALRVFKADAATKEPSNPRAPQFGKRELSRRLMDALRRSGRPMSAADLAAAVLQDRPNVSDPHTIADVAKRLRPFLRVLIMRRVVDWNGDKAAPVWWTAGGDQD
jgi:hypothetical protein